MIAPKKTKTLFLDRDGVINRCEPGKYVNRVEDFEFLPGVLIALQQLSRHFDYIFIVTNQAGVGYGYMTMKALETIHEYMLSVIFANGGKIDGWYCCTATKEENSPLRKPKPGMAFQIEKDFPNVILENSYVVGDMQSDIEFAHNIGATPILLTRQLTAVGIGTGIFRDLRHFADWLDMVESVA